jgi:heterodisulfide reductase subunit C
MTSEPSLGSGRTIHVDLARRRRVLAAFGGEHALYCYQCGACVGDCPSARFDASFNPRAIVLAALLGDLEPLLAPESPIWKCSNCYTCYERCPQDVRPVEVILALKNLTHADGGGPAPVASVVDAIRATGRSAPLLATLNRKREVLGLPAIAAVDVAELARLLAPDEEPAPPASPTSGEAST